jgi:hypothetical protein
MKMSAITRKSLHVDRNQGETKSGCAFGFVGTHAIDDYQGWFFTWPSRHARVTSEEEIDSVIKSLDADETCRGEKQIPYRFAVAVLREYLTASLAAQTAD